MDNAAIAPLPPSPTGWAGRDRLFFPANSGAPAGPWMQSDEPSGIIEFESTAPGRRLSRGGVRMASTPHSSMKITSILYIAVLLLAASVAAQYSSPESTRRQFLEIVRPEPCDLNPIREKLSAPDGYLRQKVIIQSEPGHRVALLAIRPAVRQGRLPVVVVLHGTRGRKERHEDVLYELASRGFLAVAPDARYHGELALEDYEDAAIRAWREKRGHPWLYETVTDTIRVLDYLVTRSDVDPRRIGMTGFSMGGMNTWLTAAVDPRVAAAAPCIGVTSFGYQLRTGDYMPRVSTLPRFHQAVMFDLGESELTARVVREAWAQVLPGIEDRFDCPQMLAAIAPRPLLIVNGEIDRRCPMQGVRLCYTMAQEAYQRSGALDRLRLEVAPDIGHKVTPDQMALVIDWFEQWLAPSDHTEPVP